MKTRQLTILFSVMIFLQGIATAQTKSLTINTNTSSIEWTGKKVLGQHHGTVNLSNGNLNLKGTTLSGGSFTIDMTSIKDLDLKDEDYNKKLIGHLKSADFFNVEQYNTAIVKITKVEKYKSSGNYKITADVTIKGITKPVIFDATLTQSGTKFSGTANIIIDRTKWDIKYGSASFFDNIGDKAISDNIELNVKIETI